MMDAVNLQRIAPWILYMGVHAASDHGTSSYRVDGCCDNIRMHYMPGPWMRQEPVNPGLHKAGRSNRNDDVESISPAWLEAPRPQRPPRPQPGEPNTLYN